MVKKTIFEDDLDGSPNAQTVKYSFEGLDYEIDLSDANLEKFREALKPYLDNSRKVPRDSASGSAAASRSRRSSGGRGTTDTGRHAAIREWAKKQQDARGWKVADRGRIPQNIIDEYDKAHQ
jgi:hypothetical protein